MPVALVTSVVVVTTAQVARTVQVVAQVATVRVAVVARAVQVVTVRVEDN